MLTTLSALPAEDTENHHHTKIKKGKGKCPRSVPTGSNRLQHQSLLKNLWGRPLSLLWLQERLLIQKGGSPLSNSSLAKLVESLLLEY